MTERAGFRNIKMKEKKSRKVRFCAMGLSVVLCLVCLTTGWGSDAEPQAEASLRSGDYESAVKHFRSALKQDPGNGRFQAGLLQTLRETGAYREALEQAETLQNPGVESAPVYLELGRISTAVGAYGEAERYFRRSIDLSSSDTVDFMDAVRELAELMEYTGRKDDAADLWETLLDAYRRGPVQGSRRLGDVAVAAWRRGYIYDARDIIMDATDPRIQQEVSLAALTDFGYQFLEKYNFTDALDVFRDCLEINEFYPDALIGISLGKRGENDFDAEVYARAALKVNPNFVPAFNLLAELAMDEEKPEAALQEIQRALAVNPSDLHSLSLLAIYHYFNSHLSEFAGIEQKIIDINPAYGKFYYLIAEQLVSRRKYRESVDFYRKAINLNPELWAAYTGLGMNLTRIGEFEAGRRAIDKAFDGDGFNARAYNSLELFDTMDNFVQSANGHFILRISKEDAPVLSGYASDLAEEAYEKLTRRYSFEPQGPIQLEVFPDHKGFAVRALGLPGLEGALGVCFGKVIAMFSTRAIEDGPLNWGTVLWHEFVHVLTLQMSHHNIPRWYSEGLSVYEEWRARPGWGDALEAGFVRAFKEGRLLKASELNSGIVRPKDPEQIVLAYYQAGLVCEMLEEKYGFDKIRQSLLLFGRNTPPEEVFLQAFGLDARALDAEYARFLDLRYKEIASRLFFRDAGKPGNAADARRPEREELERRLERNPDDFYSNLILGSLLAEEGSDSEAEKYLVKAKDLFPQYVRKGNPYELLGRMYLEQDREDDALEVFTAWSRIAGSSGDPLFRSAEIYRKRQDWTGLENVLSRAIFFNPYDPDVQKMLGNAAMEIGNWTSAASAFRAQLGLDVSDPAGAHYNLARVLFAAGNTPEARREVLRALEIAPSYIEAQELLLKISEAVQ
ncbi:MAG: tetratricopeptide repeat protein [Acidobacteriota bacterium]